MKKLLIIILLISTKCFSQCKYTVFVNQQIVKHDTTFCGGYNKTVAVMADCDTIEAFVSTYVLELNGQLLQVGKEGDKFYTQTWGKYVFSINKTFFDGHLQQQTLLKFNIINKKTCNCSE